MNKSTSMLPLVVAGFLIGGLVGLGLIILAAFDLAPRWAMLPIGGIASLLRSPGAQKEPMLLLTMLISVAFYAVVGGIVTFSFGRLRQRRAVDSIEPPECVVCGFAWVPNLPSCPNCGNAAAFASWMASPGRTRCPKCRYDLRGFAAFGKCPECGLTITSLV